MNAKLGELRNGRFSDWPLAVKSILGFWLVYAATVVVRAFLGTDPGTVLYNRAPTIAGGILLTFGVYLVINLLAGNAPIRRKAITAAVASLLAAIALASIVIALDDWFRPSKEEHRLVAREGYVLIEKGHQIRIERTAQEPLVMTLPPRNQMDRAKQIRWVADGSVTWFFFFAAWSAFYLASLAQAQALGAQRRAAEAEAAARSAQVRALRYQVNPHFLFNTLNSLSSLIMTGKPDKAEEMLLKLSTFFRTSLSLDPSADVTLAEEIALQRLYLDIEKVRFPRRLQVEIDVPPELEAARLPALILQPVVENAIKHGVSPTREKVTLTIVAREAGPGRFTIELRNSAAARPKAGKEAPDGTGVGISNVCDRLAARFGDAAKCEFGPTGDGGYRVVLTLPLDRSNG